MTCLYDKTMHQVLIYTMTGGFLIFLCQTPLFHLLAIADRSASQEECRQRHLQATKSYHQQPKRFTGKQQRPAKKFLDCQGMRHHTMYRMH